MNYFNLIYRVVLIISGVFYSANLSAQQADSTFSDIKYILRNNAWLSSRNSSGLKYFVLPKLSTSQLFFNKSDGNFINYHQSDDSYRYGLEAESIYRLTTKVVFSGAIGYDTFKGKHMGGSMFINPYEVPIDIVEGNSLNKGDKEQESYKLTGKVGAQLTKKISVGAGIEYEAANFAKMKDLRHINKLLDLNLSFGGLYQLSNAVELGMNYNYTRRIESMSFKSFGNKETVFSSIISFGAFYGSRDTFDKEGYTSSDNTSPLADIGHGASLQFSIYFNNKIKLFNEFSYIDTKGGYGEKRTAKRLFTEHRDKHITYNGTLSVFEGKNEHHLTLKADYNTLINNENRDITQTPVGGIERIIVFVTNEVLDRQQLKANLKYTLFKNVSNNNPAWTFEADVDYFRRQQTISMSPFYRDQTINSYQAKANVKRNIIRANRMYSATFGLGYGSGDGLVKYDGIYFDPSTSPPPASMDLYLYQEFEYLTKPRVMADVSLQYTKKMNPNIAPYARLSYNYTKAFDTQFLGSSFGIAGASLGCNF